MARNARYELGLDLWDLSFSQLTGYLGMNQCVSERVSEFICLGVSPQWVLCQVWDICSTTTETRETALIGQEKKEEKNPQHHM